ncbi:MULTISPECIES: DUF2188 domain-containing protein [Oceanobacillus]|uniref:DUF2188 domain-containing protein n=1 Tax=Oceanobacillus indicireducens TaxID=1004261 RepID=A0A918D2C2_9BACI|nr:MULTISPECIES: DUF2188 domain-containing protein [Oceanobacillus]GGN58954.1 hypothetical protein GCM10007971_21590 [Oceanobacillus indicireducens]
MVWTIEDYPPSMKNLPDVTRKKAIDIANAMIDEGYEEGRALPIAISQAKEWRENATDEEVEHYRKYGKVTTRSPEDRKHKSNPERMEEGEIVRAHEDGWAVESKGAERPSNVFDAKRDAIKRAKEIADNKGTSVTVYKKDGTVQEKYSFD